ncbi:hypothetical protein ACH42_02500 [Endozoicomonas sp. (ex Bugula neritina AB1)]|nr:hypothetical protein ACH42_02500 [Endozoicomonas sp. (ex Bugula neritina AB1)]
MAAQFMFRRWAFMITCVLSRLLHARSFELLSLLGSMFLRLYDLQSLSIIIGFKVLVVNFKKLRYAFQKKLPYFK